METINERYMDLKVINIRDAGEDKERVLIRVLNDCNLNGYMIIDNTYDDNGQISNVHRHVFVFPDFKVTKGNIVRLYTKKGSNFTVKANYGKDIVTYYNFYWGFESGSTVWNKDGDTAYLLHYDIVEPGDFE